MNQAPPIIKRQSKKNKNWVVGVFLVVLFICMLLAGLLFYQSQLELRRSVVEADSGFTKATNSINPEELRAWALKNIQNKATEKELYDSMPEYIRTLYRNPPRVLILDESVSFLWGGPGFSYWTIHVGPTNSMTRTGVIEGRKTIEWVPGIFYNNSI